MQAKPMSKGRMLYLFGDRLYMARGATLLRSRDCGKSWDPWVQLPVGVWLRLLMRIPLLARLLRLGVHHLVFSGEKVIVFVNRESFLLEDNQVISLGALHGQRPLAVGATDGTAFYGEYRSNPERSAVHIYGLDLASHTWRSVWRFEAVRHIHGVFHDPYTDTFWVTTGDEDEESAIWFSDDRFETLKKVVGGNQQFRVIQLLFTSEYVYFGSDSPNEVNHLYRMKRNGESLEQLATVGGSVFYGCSVGNSLFFSTAVEPSPVNTSLRVEVWGTNDGENWKLVFGIKKDWLSMRYFQYGQALFPSGQGDGKTVYWTSLGNQSHEVVFRLDLEEVEF